MPKEKIDLIGRWTIWAVGIVFGCAMVYANVNNNTERITKLEDKMDRYSEAVIKMEVTVSHMSGDLSHIMTYLMQYDFERKPDGKETSHKEEKEKSYEEG